MPKISHAGPTVDGFTGHVRDAEQRLHEVSPLHDVDGQPHEGVDVEPLRATPAVGDAPSPLAENAEEREGEEERPTGREGEETSAGNSSSESSQRNASTSSKRQSRR